MTLSPGQGSVPFTVDNDGTISVGHDPECKRLDYEVQDSWNVVLTATDSGGETATCAVKISVVDVNEPPILAATSTSVSNQLAVAEFFGKPVSVLDYDSGQRHSYSVVGGDGGVYFDIEESTGRLFVKSSLASLDGGLRKRVRVRVHDDGEGNLMSENWIEVTVVNDNMPPVFASSRFRRSFPEGSASGHAVGRPLEASDPDGHSITFKKSAQAEDQT
jgi:hypothetical protein